MYRLLDQSRTRTCNRYECAIFIFHVGYRRYLVCPIFSLHSNGDKHKYEKFLTPDTQMVATLYAPITFGPCPVSVYKRCENNEQVLVATGSVLDVSNRIVVKRIISKFKNGQWTLSTLHIMDFTIDTFYQLQCEFLCEICKKTFKMEMLRDIHLKNYEKDPPKNFACDQCSKLFANEQLLKGHMKRHNTVQTLLCEQCGKGFTSQSSLRLHKFVHEEKKYKCPKCDLRFSRELYLKRHSFRHENQQIICSICGAGMTNRGLESHMRIHKRTESDRKYACTHCPKKFFLRQALKSHMFETHVEGKQFECEYCDRKYKHKGDLSKHLRTHLGDDMYECETCHKRFRQPYELNRHMDEHYVPPNDEKMDIDTL